MAKETLHLQSIKSCALHVYAKLLLFQAKKKQFGLKGPSEHIF